jgi:hypothetical protein
MPLVAGILSAFAVLFVWGSLAPVPVMHDEWAYWMQAQQYGALHWAYPAPALPEFFEQLYVLVTPVFAAKYPPGHALGMALGSAMGVPALVPLLMTGVTGALVFALARRVADTVVASATFMLWLGTFGNLRFRASYFSEVTTSLCWLVAWWALLEWRETRATKWMVTLAVAIGWGAITRPATMFVFAIPVGVVVVRDVLATKRWRDLGIGVVCGTAVLAILPLWSARTTGDWKVNPLTLYTQQYLPFDAPGYTVNETAPQRALPAEMERVRSFLHEIKVEQADAPVWKTAWDRTRLLFLDAFGGWRLLFALTFLIGLQVAGTRGWFALGSSGLLIVGYLAQAHTADWTIYYLEAFPVFAFISALGVAFMLRKLGAPPESRGVLSVVGVVAALLLARDVWNAKSILDRIAVKPRAFTEAVAALPKRPNIVFVTYAPRRFIHVSLVANRGVLADAASWVVHDRGDADATLLAAAPGRTGYRYDEATRTFTEIVR